MNKTAEKTFEDHYKGLSEKERVEVRDKFLEKTGLSYPSWYGKIRNMNFTKLEMTALCDICGINLQQR